MCYVKRFRCVFLGVFLLLSACASLMGVQGGSVAHRQADVVIWGDEPGQLSLVLAQVTHVGKPDPESFWHPMTVRPLATLSGGFDSARQEELDLLFHFVAPGDPDLPIKAVPAVNDLVMAVITRREEGYIVEANFCTFMPWRSPLVIVNGLDDPRIQEVANRVQKARQKAATRPAELTDLALLRSARVTFAERLRIAATATDPRVLNLLADFEEPFEVQLLVAMNRNTPVGIVEGYLDLPQDAIDRFKRSEHELLRAAAQWNLRQRSSATTRASSECELGTP